MGAVLFAASLGLFAGISPGPLMTLVMTASLERGFRAGALTAIAPLLTDLPVILLSLLVLGQVPGWFLSAVTVAGGLFVIYIGATTVRDAGRVREVELAQEASRRDLARGALVNFLSPHPWLFWFTVGSPFMIQRWPVARWEAIAFLVVFIAVLVGCKITLAWGVSHGRRFLGTAWYRWILAGCGVLLIGFGLVLLWQGVSGLGLV
jgi:threonine/homoserine/homoserine lactone efflux protein